MHAGVHARSHVCSHMAHGLGKIIEIVEARGDKITRCAMAEMCASADALCGCRRRGLRVRREEMRKRMCLIYSVPLAHHLFRSSRL